MTERDASGREILLNSLNRRDEHKSRYTHNGIAAPMGSRDERKLGRASHRAKSGGGLTMAQKQLTGSPPQLTESETLR